MICATTLKNIANGKVKQCFMTSNYFHEKYGATCKETLITRAANAKWVKIYAMPETFQRALKIWSNAEFPEIKVDYAIVDEGVAEVTLDLSGFFKSLSWIDIFYTCIKIAGRNKRQTNFLKGIGALGNTFDDWSGARFVYEKLIKLSNKSIEKIKFGYGDNGFVYRGFNSLNYYAAERITGENVERKILKNGN